MVTLDVVAVQLERLSERIEALGGEQQTLAALVRQLVDRETPESWRISPKLAPQPVGAAAYDSSMSLRNRSTRLSSWSLTAISPN
jgi:hypothetical protein